MLDFWLGGGGGGGYSDPVWATMERIVQPYLVEAIEEQLVSHSVARKRRGQFEHRTDRRLWYR